MCVWVGGWVGGLQGECACVCVCVCVCACVHVCVCLRARVYVQSSSYCSHHYSCYYTHITIRTLLTTAAGTWQQRRTRTRKHARASRVGGEGGGGLVFDMYTNGDVVFTMGLVDTLKEVKKLWSRSFWFICVTWNIHIHRKSSLYLPLGSVNLALKVMGTPDEISSPAGWNRVSLGCPRNSNTELTEPTKQIKTTFPMNTCDVKHSYVRLGNFGVGLSSSYVWRKKFLHVQSLAYKLVCFRSFSRVEHRNYKFVCVVCMRAISISHAWRALFVCVPWPIRMCDIAHSCVWQAQSYVWPSSLIRVTWLIHVGVASTLKQVKKFWVRSCWFIHMTWLIRTCDITHSYVWHNSFIRVGRVDTLNDVKQLEAGQLRRRITNLNIWVCHELTQNSFIRVGRVDALNNVKQLEAGQLRRRIMNLNIWVCHELTHNSFLRVGRVDTLNDVNDLKQVNRDDE